MTAKSLTNNKADFPPPMAGRNFLCPAETGENPIFQGYLAPASLTVRHDSTRNDSETRRVETGKIRGICSSPVPGGAI